MKSDGFEQFLRDSYTGDVNIEFLANRSFRIALSKTVFVNSVRYRYFRRKCQRCLRLSSHPRPLPAVSAEHKMRGYKRMARRSGGHTPKTVCGPVSYVIKRNMPYT